MGDVPHVCSSVPSTFFAAGMFSVLPDKSAEFPFLTGPVKCARKHTLQGTPPDWHTKVFRGGSNRQRRAGCAPGVSNAPEGRSTRSPGDKLRAAEQVTFIFLDG